MVTKEEKLHLTAATYAESRQYLSIKYRKDLRLEPYDLYATPAIFLHHYEGFRDGWNAAMNSLKPKE